MLMCRLISLLWWIVRGNPWSDQLLFHNFWTVYHVLCNSDQNCFFCNLRSSCLRLRKIREKGPRSIKLNEFVSQLNQFDQELSWNWRENLEDMPTFLENTLRLITKSESKISSFFVHKELQCQLCKQDPNNQTNFIFSVNIKEKKEITVKDLLEQAILKT